MERDAFKQVTAQLEADRAEATDAARRLRQELTSVEARLADLDVVLERLARLAPVEPVAGPQLDIVVVDHDDHADPEPEYDADVPVDDAGSTSVVPIERRKVRSTQMVADLINDAGQVISRDQVEQMFSARYGIPTGWTNASNAIGVALGRASTRGLITRLSADSFAPRGYRHGSTPQPEASNG